MFIKLKKLIFRIILTESFKIKNIYICIVHKHEEADINDLKNLYTNIVWRN